MPPPLLPLIAKCAPITEHRGGTSYKEAISLLMASLFYHLEPAPFLFNFP